MLPTILNRSMTGKQRRSSTVICDLVHSKSTVVPRVPNAWMLLFLALALISKYSSTKKGKTKNLFRIQVSDVHKNVNFKVLDTSSFSSSATGILGRFLPVGAYEVRPDLSNASTGFLVFNGKMTEVNYKRHAWNKNCWTLSETDFLEMVDLA